MPAASGVVDTLVRVLLSITHRVIGGRGERVMVSSEEFDPEKSEEAGEQKFYGFEEDVSGINVPTELPILPLRGVVIFPSAIAPLLISRGTSLKLIEDVLVGDRMLGLVAQKNAE